jgi:nitrogen fixation-related uncharacterized protein
VRSGQYDDPEGPKYRMLEDDDGEAPNDPDSTRSGRDANRMDGPPRTG